MLIKEKIERKDSVVLTEEGAQKKRKIIDHSRVYEVSADLASKNRAKKDGRYDLDKGKLSLLLQHVFFEQSANILLYQTE